MSTLPHLYDSTPIKINSAGKRPFTSPRLSTPLRSPRKPGKIQRGYRNILHFMKRFIGSSKTLVFFLAFTVVFSGMLLVKYYGMNGFRICKKDQVKKCKTCIRKGSIEERAYNISDNVRKIIKINKVKNFNELVESIEPRVDNDEVFRLAINCISDVALVEDHIIVKMTDEVELSILIGLSIFCFMFLCLSLIFHSKSKK